MSKIQFGLPLAQPSAQTLLPLITDSGRIYGWFPITKTTFNGSETSVTLSGGVVVPVTTVTLPPTVATNQAQSQRVTQYMASYFPISQEYTRPWLSYPDSLIVRPDYPNDIGYYSWWSMPVTTVIEHFNRGTFLNAMIFRLDPTVPVPGTPTPPTVTTPSAITWTASLDPQTFSPECAFFDFNWVDLFKVAQQANPNQYGSAVTPLAIATVSNPSGGALKATIVQQYGQDIYPGGGVVFSTVRILRLADVAPGTYTFTFNISYTQDGAATPLTVPATLNLTIQ